VPAFEHLAGSTAAALRATLPETGHAAVILFDVPFLGVPPLLPAALLPAVAVVPRSTGPLHDPAGHDRIQFERDGLSYLSRHGGRVAAISQFMRQHLIRDFGVRDAALLDLPDGLTPQEWQPQPGSPPALPPAALGGFLLALGRAQPYKGWDDLIDALAILRRQGRPVPHAVLAAVTDQAEPTDYQRQLAHRVQGLGLDATLLTRFDPGIRALLGHPALRAAVIPSRTEPFGRVPLEAYAAGAAPIVVTTAGGLAEQVIDGVTGLTAAPADPASLARAMDRALSLTGAERDQMRAAGRQLARTRFDHTRAVRYFLHEFAPWAGRDSVSCPAVG